MKHPSLAVTLASTIALVIGMRTVVSPQPARPAPAVASSGQAVKPDIEQFITLNFEGGDIPANAAKALQALVSLGLVESGTASIDRKGMCGVLKTRTKFPGGCGEDLQKLGAAMNPARARSSDPTKVKYPDADFVPYTYPVEYNRHSEADLKALQDARANWGNYIRRESSDASYTTLMLTGYELRVPVKAGAKVDPVALLKLRSKYVFVDLALDRKNDRPKYSFVQDDLKGFQEFCTAPQPAEGCYCSLIGSPIIDAPKCDSASTTCPDLVILDTLVFRHPAITPALAEGGAAGEADPNPATTRPRCLTSAEQVAAKKKYHGTELAGIVASQGRGAFSGIHPGARLVSLDGTRLNSGNGSQLASAVASRRDLKPGTPQIYMFASSWRFPPSDADGMRLNDKESRWTGNLGATRIRGLRQTLWVVAAGQEDLSADPPLRQEDVTTNLALGPMNLGDAENVLVVTACEDCRGSRGQGPQLMPKVNYSTAGLVHVAAPGERIPSTASQFQFGEASGTSPATAFVAGLASAMMTKYPGAFDPAKLKSRIQYTSTPWTTAGADRIATGVVDAKAAMLDPSKNYLNGVAVDIESWCAADTEHSGLTMVDGNNEEMDLAHIPTRLIHRIKEVAPSAGRRQWVVYRARERYNDSPADVLRIGPGLPIPPSGSGHPERRPVIKLKNQAKPIVLDNIQDLLVRRGGTPVKTCVP